MDLELSHGVFCWFLGPPTCQEDCDEVPKSVLQEDLKSDLTEELVPS